MILAEKQKLDTVEYERIYKVLETNANRTVDYFLNTQAITQELASSIIASTIETLIDKSLKAITDSASLDMSGEMHIENMRKIKTEVFLLPKTIQYENIQESMKSLSSAIGDYALGGLVVPPEMMAKQLALIDQLANTVVIQIEDAGQTTTTATE